MQTLRLFASGQMPIHPAAAWYLSDLGEFRGKQELYTRQSPQRLKALREHALIESAVSSNRIEGVSVEPSRVGDVLIAPRPLFRDRDEEEVRGYRDALAWIHQDAASIPWSEATIRQLHAMTRGQIWDAGQYKEKDGDIIERYADGSERVRFRTLSAHDTPSAMVQWVGDWQRCLDERWMPPLIALAACNMAYREFAERVGEVKTPRGSKRDLVQVGIERLVAKTSGGFTISELEYTCPGVSRDMVRRVLREQQAAGQVECSGRGTAALWRKKR